MIPLSFIEINHVREKKQNEDLGIRVRQNSYFAFVANVVEETGVRDITDEISDGRYLYKPEYTIFYLYDYMHDDASCDFLENHGGKLHRDTSANISIITYFTSDMVEKWTNVPFRDSLIGDKNRDYNNIISKIRNLQDLYHVRDLPSLVIVKNGGKGLDESCVVSLKGCSEKAIYNTTIGIIRKINENYEESFEYITDLIEGREYSKNMHKEEFSTYNFIEDLTKTESKLGLKGLASELGYDVKTLYNRRVKRTFKREELFYIAVRFGISVNDLNKLLRENGRQELGYSGKDGVIRRALIDGLSIFDVECELGESIISPKEDKSE